MSFTTRIAIAFGDTDPAGLVYYPNILHYCHVAMERFFAEFVGVAYSNLIREERVGFPTVKIEAEFLVPILYGDEIEIEIQVRLVGNSSVTLGYLIRRTNDGNVCARFEQVHVAMDLNTHRAIPVPGFLRGRLTDESAALDQQ